MPRPFCLFQQLLDLIVVRFIEVDEYERIVSYVEPEGSLGNLLPELLRHPRRHVFLVSLLRINSPDVVIPHDRDEWDIPESALDRVDSIVQHLGVHLAAAAVPLDQVPHLEHHLRIPGNQACSPVKQLRAPLPPHFSVPEELCIMHFVAALVRLDIKRMIHRGRLGVEMGVTEDDYRIPARILYASVKQ